jgi:plastocyanin
MSRLVIRDIVKAGWVLGGLAVALAGTVAAASSVRMVHMNDQCDPTSFNAALGAGTCVSAHAGVQFDDFIRELTKTQKVGAWNFTPRQVHLRADQAFLAQNRGGEVHTFTEVDEFGGGIVPMLNTLSGNPVAAPECLALAAGDFIPPGGVTTPEVETPGVHHYQCCIHPWMRTDVTVR